MSRLNVYIVLIDKNLHLSNFDKIKFLLKLFLLNFINKKLLKYKLNKHKLTINFVSKQTTLKEKL